MYTLTYDVKEIDNKEEAIMQIKYIESKIPFYGEIKYYTFSINNNYNLIFFYLEVNKNNIEYIKKLFKNSNKFNIVKYDIGFDITFVEVYIEYRSLKKLEKDLENTIECLLESEIKELKKIRNYNNNITYKDTILLEKELKTINKIGIELKIVSLKKLNKYIKEGYYNKLNKYLRNKDHNKRLRDKIFTNEIYKILEEVKEEEKNKRFNESYGIYDKRFEKVDNYNDYENFNYESYYNLKDLKFKNFNYKL